MKIAIIAPTRIDAFCNAVNIQKIDYEHFLYNLSEQLAGTQHEIVVIPSNHSVQGTVLKLYKDFGGKKVIGIVPLDDEEMGIRDLEPELADEIINCGTWRNQPEKMCEVSDVLLVVGLSPGAMIEICYTKWFKVEKVLVVKDFLYQKLMPEVEKDLDLKYISKDEVLENLR